MIINESKPAVARTVGAHAFEDVFELCVDKSRNNINRLADEPKSAAWAANGNYFDFKEAFYEIGNWTSSFLTGMALLAWRDTKDDGILQQVQRLAPFYRAKVFTHYLDTHHDLGFLYSLYSVALFKLTGHAQHRKTALRAADLLAQRFNEKGGFIRAWGRMDTTEQDNMAIIDCLMNLPLLFWAANISGNSQYHQVAVRHADMFLKNFIRPDGSVFHAFRFDLSSGRPLGGDNYCGYSVDSFWARGVSWAIYGLALSYGYTRDQKYLSAAVQLAKTFVAHLDSEWVPVWDFKLPVGEKPLRDSSAAAVAVCAFQEITRHHAADAQIIQVKNSLLERLCTDDYLEFDPACPGILKKGQVGDGVGKACNAFTSWGDYFLMEALASELTSRPSFW